jgi:hypothetical protein
MPAKTRGTPLSRQFSNPLCSQQLWEFFRVPVPAFWGEFLCANWNELE